jgi:hypothetical protein
MKILGSGPGHARGFAAAAAAVFELPGEEMRSRAKVRREPTMEWARVLHLVQQYQ